MKKILIIFILSFSILLVGCTSKTKNEIVLGGFLFDLKTNDIVYENISNNFGDYNLDESFLDIAYIEKNIISGNNNSYLNSLLFSKFSFDSGMNIFVESNIDKIKNSLDDFSVDGSKSIDFDCNNLKINGIVEQFHSNYLDNNIIYFAEYFFSYNQKKYIISFSSEKKLERDMFVSSLKTLHCL